MGKAISYCYKCSSLLREDDFAQGKAVRLSDRVACAACAPEAAPAPAAAPKSQASRPPGAPPSTRRLARPPESKSKTPLVAGGAAFMVQWRRRPRASDHPTS